MIQTPSSFSKPADSQSKPRECGVQNALVHNQHQDERKQPGLQPVLKRGPVQTESQTRDRESAIHAGNGLLPNSGPLDEGAPPEEAPVFDQPD